MNVRQRKLMHMLLTQSGNVFHINRLASHLECSEKTVRNDLDVIENFLSESFHDARLVRKPGVGISLQVDEVAKKALSDMLLSKEPITREDRVIEMAYQLLMTKRPITLNELSEKYFVSKANIRKDLETIETWLDRFRLKLQTKERVGSYLEGSEIDKRSALANLSDLIPSMIKGRKYVLNLFLPHEVSEVKRALQELVTKFSIDITDEALESLLIHFLIMLKRIRMKSAVTLPKDEQQVSQRPEYEYTSWLFEKLANPLRIKFPEDERIYFTWHLVSSRKKGDLKEVDLLENEEVKNIINMLIEKVGKLTFIDFHFDQVLTDGLYVHMYSVVNRLKYGLPITNPLLVKIKKMYPYMFSMVMLSLEDINKTFDLEIPEDEAGYLVLHFQASLERLERNKKTKKKTVIVCHMGVGISNLLAAKIEQHFDDVEILSVIGKYDLSGFMEKHSVDFIISTTPLKNVNTPSVVVSPLLERKDKEKLSHFITEISKKTNDDQSFSTLCGLLDDELIFTKVRKKHRFDVIRLLGDSLLGKGKVTEGYTENVLNREEKSATSIGGAIAIPHGNPLMVKTSCVALAVLDEPLEWGHELVSVVFMLALDDDITGLSRKVIGDIANISDHPALVQQLIKAEEPEYIIEILGKQQ